MHLHAHLDLDLVAVEQPDEVVLLLELAAPTADADAERPPATIQVVLDRSGSMAGERLHAARTAIAALVDRLRPDDQLGVVTFDSEVDVLVPCGPLHDRAAVRAAVLAIESGGMTNLSGGLLRGAQEAARAAAGGPGAPTLLLLSDGHANEGLVDPVQLEGFAATQHRRHGLTIATIGIGDGYDELLLSSIARGGSGAHVFADDGDAAGAAVAGEVAGLLSKTVQAASLLIRPTGAVSTVHVVNDLPAAAVDQAIMVELGDLWGGEQRKVLLKLGVPAMPALGLAQVAELELRWVALPAFEEHAVTLPVHVNVVPGDQAAGRIPDPTVRRELLFQQAQAAKREAADLLDRGDAAAAASLLRSFRDAAMPALPDEGAVLGALADDIDARRHRIAAKRARAEHAMKSRKRGRDLRG